MKKYRQKVTGANIGDCYRACIATLLQLPPDVLPNDFTPRWPIVWHDFLAQFGLAMSPPNPPDKPIWYSSLWLASVKSLNYEGTLHAILMHGGSVVFHDPSNKKRYKTGAHLSSKEVVSGSHLVVADARLLHKLQEYRDVINPPELSQQLSKANAKKEVR